MRRKHLVAVVIVIFLAWNMLMYHMLVSRNPAKSDALSVQTKLLGLQGDIKKQLSDNSVLLEQLRKFRDRKEEEKAERELRTTKLAPVKSEEVDPNKVVLPILMIACDRVTVSRSLDLLLNYRKDPERFPIIVSQDCGHEATANVIKKYVDRNQVKHIKHPNLKKIELPWPQKKFLGYYKLSRHYKWALDQVFHVFNHSAVIIVEDDLDVSPDFFEYFAATFPILHEDKSLWCVSAWNDNGKNGMVAEEPETLYRSDFFPGLGWSMEKKTWLELGPKWPEAFWDDWMRHTDQRKGRACIRPEICRTSTFGKKGVSKGLFYEKHLKFIHLNSKFVPFTEKDLSYLKKENYDKAFLDKVYNLPAATLPEITARAKTQHPALRLTYATKEEYKMAAKKLGIMDDFKAGVPRVAYLGIVSFMYQGQRIHLAPPKNWKGYDPKWS